MVWTIETWDPATGTGTVRSPHFAGLPFGRRENAQGVEDFSVGETVVVEFASVDRHVIASVVPTHQRQPAGTHVPLFDAVNRGGDVHVEESGTDQLRLWIGDCCAYCSPNAPRLLFEGVTVNQLSPALESDAVELSDPLFRAASRTEIAEQDLLVPEGACAYCVVTTHGAGPDGPKLFLVARSARVMQPEDSVQ